MSRLKVNRRPEPRDTFKDVQTAGENKQDVEQHCGKKWLKFKEHSGTFSPLHQWHSVSSPGCKSLTGDKQTNKQDKDPRVRQNWISCSGKQLNNFYLDKKQQHVSAVADQPAESEPRRSCRQWGYKETAEVESGVEDNLKQLSATCLLAEKSLAVPCRVLWGHFLVNLNNPSCFLLIWAT